MNNKAKMDYNNAYNKENYTGISFRLKSTSDAEVLAMLKAQDNLKAYICKLVMADIRQKERKKGRVMNRGDRRIHDNIKLYPYEIIEELPNGDRYSVGFCDDMQNAMLMIAEYAARREVTGPLHILQRSYDPDMRCIMAVEVPYAE